MDKKYKLSTYSKRIEKKSKPPVSPIQPEKPRRAQEDLEKARLGALSSKVAPPTLPLRPILPLEVEKKLAWLLSNLFGPYWRNIGPAVEMLLLHNHQSPFILPHLASACVSF
jgi:hypothetical protein